MASRSGSRRGVLFGDTVRSGGAPNYARSLRSLAGSLVALLSRLRGPLASPDRDLRKSTHSPRALFPPGSKSERDQLRMEPARPFRDHEQGRREGVVCSEDDTFPTDL